jgi:hypothetical protein
LSGQLPESIRQFPAFGTGAVVLYSASRKADFVARRHIGKYPLSLKLRDGTPVVVHPLKRRDDTRL